MNLMYQCLYLDMNIFPTLVWTSEPEHIFIFGVTYIDWISEHNIMCIAQTAPQKFIVDQNFFPKKIVGIWSCSNWSWSKRGGVVSQKITFDYREVRGRGSEYEEEKNKIQYIKLQQASAWYVHFKLRMCKIKVGVKISISGSIKSISARTSAHC